MKRPKFLRIGADKFKIVYTKPGTKKGILLEDEMGAVHTERRTIWLDNSLDERARATVLIHEILHAIADIIEGNKNQFAKEWYSRTFTTLLFQALKTSGLIKLKD